MDNVIVGPWASRPERPHQQAEDLDSLMASVLTASNVIRFPRRPPHQRFGWLWKSAPAPSSEANTH
ncbi:MAG: hypothetical protein IT536_18900 [Hyphomicrobiales bacterium]|nr:hypothetical protein [Hyphomicrobiales bacterium]